MTGAGDERAAQGDCDRRPHFAGKRTFAREFLNHEAYCPVFINADLIAAGIAPFEPEKAAIRAGRIMLELMREKYLARESFAIETTLAGRGYARLFQEWHDVGYHITLHYLSLESTEIAMERVALRVSQGGHSISEEVIRRRFEAGLENFEHVYRLIVDEWYFYNGSDWSPQLLRSGVNR